MTGAPFRSETFGRKVVDLKERRSSLSRRRALGGSERPPTVLQPRYQYYSLMTRALWLLVATSIVYPGVRVRKHLSDGVLRYLPGLVRQTGVGQPATCSKIASP